MPHAISLLLHFFWAVSFLTYGYVLAFLPRSVIDWHIRQLQSKWTKTWFRASGVVVLIIGGTLTVLAVRDLAHYAHQASS